MFHQQLLLAREEERKQIARDLHDQIIQSLVGFNYHLVQLDSSCCEQHSSRIAYLHHELRQIIDDVRRICVSMRPPVLDNLGLIAAIRSFVRTCEQHYPQTILLEIDAETDEHLSELVAITIYRVLQEAFANIAKHATQASHIWVDLQITDRTIRLQVSDNGNGFIVPKQLDCLLQQHHLGLVGMRERIDSIQGSLQISSAPNQGTVICVEAPVVSYYEPVYLPNCDI